MSAPVPIRRAGRLRRDLALIRADGIAFSLMVGLGETYLVAFALAVGTSDVFAGLLAALPLVAGGVLQLLAPSAMHRAPSYRAWVTTFAGLQACTFLPLVAGALTGTAPAALLFACAAVYWGAGLATAPAWNAWMSHLVPARIRSSYFGARQGAAQVGVLAGLVAGGVLLDRFGDDARAFAIVFGAAFACRAVSVYLISRQSVPPGRPPPERARARTLLGRARRSGSREMILYIVIVHFAVHLASPFFTPFLLVQTRLSYAEFMLLLAANFMGKILSYPALGRLARRAGVRQLMALGAIGLAPLPILWTLSPSMLYLFTVQSLAGVFWAAFELSVLLSFLDVADDRERTGLLATYHLINSSAIAGASVVGGILLALLGQDRSAYVTLFTVSAVGRGLGLALLIARARRSYAVEVPPLRILAVRPWGEAIIRPVLATFDRARRLGRRDPPDDPLA